MRGRLHCLLLRFIDVRRQPAMLQRFAQLEPHECAGGVARDLRVALVRQLLDHLRVVVDHAFVDDDYLVKKRLRNYWGYNTIAFFAPKPRYLATPFVNEVKEMGALASGTRTAEQTNIARFWLTSAAVIWDGALRAVAVARGLDISETAHAFALVNMR